MIRGESSIKNIKSHLAQGEWQQVIDICQQAINSSDDTTDPEAVDCYTYIARAYAQQGKLTLAIDAYQKILSISSKKAEVYAELGLLHSKQQSPREAAWHYKRALELKPKWPELQYNLGVCCCIFQFGSTLRPKR